MIIFGVKWIDVSSLFLREATELLVVQGAVTVLIHVLEDLVDIVFWQFYSESFNSLVKLMYLYLLIIVHIKE